MMDDLLVVGVTLVHACISLCSWVDLHLGLDAMFASPILTDLLQGGSGDDIEHENFSLRLTWR